MNHCHEFEALLDLYVDGELEAADMIRVQEHLDACPACQRYVDDALAIRAAFPDEESIPLPEGFHEAVMAKIAQEAAPRKKNRSLLALPTVAAACLALVVAVQALPGMGGQKEKAAAAASAPAASYAFSTTDSAAQAKSKAAWDTPAACAEVEETGLEDISEDQASYFAKLQVTPEEAETYLEGFSPITLSDGRTAYELTAEAYETLVDALGDPATTYAATTAKSAQKGLALVIVQD